MYSLEVPSQFRALFQRGSASKGIILRLCVGLGQIHGRRVGTQCAHGQSGEEVQHVEHVHVPASTKKAANPTLHSSVLHSYLACFPVKSGLLPRCIPQGMKADVEQRREGVGEIQDTNCSNDASETGEVRNRSSNNVRNRPVDRDDADPEEFARPIRERGRLEELDEYVVVDH